MVTSGCVLGQDRLLCRMGTELRQTSYRLLRYLMTSPPTSTGLIKHLPKTFHNNQGSLMGHSAPSNNSVMVHFHFNGFTCHQLQFKPVIVTPVDKKYITSANTREHFPKGIESCLRCSLIGFAECQSAVEQYISLKELIKLTLVCLQLEIKAS